METNTAANVPAARPCRCWSCERTAQVGTPAESTAIEPRLCPRCDHYYGNSLTGAVDSFRGVDSEVYVAPDALPAVVEFEAPAADVVLATDALADELCPDCAEWLDAAVALKVEEDRAATYADDEGLCIAAGINPGKF